MSWLSKFSLYSDSPRLSNQFPTSSTPQYEIMWPGKQSTVKQLLLLTMIYQRERNNHSLFYPCPFSAITLCQRAWMCKKNYSIKFSSYCHLSLWFRYRLGTGHKVQEGGKADWKKIDNKIIISSPPLGKCITKRSPPKNPHKKKAITPTLKSSRCNVFR